MDMGLKNLDRRDTIEADKSGHNSVVEYGLPKLGVAGSNPVARSLLNKEKRDRVDTASKRLEAFCRQRASQRLFKHGCG